MTTETVIWIVAIAGSSIGIAGGIFGTSSSIRGSGGEERRRIIRFSIAILVLVALFLLGLFLIPSPYRTWLWLPYSLALFLLIWRFIRRPGARDVAREPQD